MPEALLPELPLRQEPPQAPSALKAVQIRQQKPEPARTPP